MLTLGDVLAVVSTLFLSAFAATCTMVVSALLFPRRTSRAARDIEAHPWKCALAGAFFGLPLALIGLALFSIQSPALRVCGIFVLLAVMLFAAAGSGGLARLIGERISPQAPLQSILFGSFLVTGAVLLPFAGWLLLGPLCLLCSLGAGVRALFVGNKPKVAEAV